MSRCRPPDTYLVSYSTSDRNHKKDLTFFAYIINIIQVESGVKFKGCHLKSILKALQDSHNESNSASLTNYHPRVFFTYQILELIFTII